MKNVFSHMHSKVISVLMGIIIVTIISFLIFLSQVTAISHSSSKNIIDIIFIDSYENKMFIISTLILNNITINYLAVGEMRNSPYNNLIES
jgi:hypothetical protein